MHGPPQLAPFDTKRLYAEPPYKSELLTRSLKLSHAIHQRNLILNPYICRLTDWFASRTVPALPQMLLRLLVTPDQDPEILELPGLVQQLPTTQSEQPTVFQQRKPQFKSLCVILGAVLSGVIAR